jgi:hypothetical protein
MNMEPLRKVRDAWKRFLERRRAAAELATCPQSELSRIAGEVGVSEQELCSLRGDRRGPAELMPARLLRLEIDPEALRRSQTAVYRDLERVCARCKATALCAQDLAAGKVSGGTSDYCPNAHTIEALIAGKRMDAGSV